MADGTHGERVTLAWRRTFASGLVCDLLATRELRSSADVVSAALVACLLVGTSAVGALSLRVERSLRVDGDAARPVAVTVALALLLVGHGAVAAALVLHG